MDISILCLEFETIFLHKQTIPYLDKEEQDTVGTSRRTTLCKSKENVTFINLYSVYDLFSFQMKIHLK